MKSIIGVKACSPIDWLLLAASQILSLILTILAYFYNIKKFRQEDSQDPSKKSQRTLILLMSWFTGIAAGTLGIGGGMWFVQVD